MHDEEGEARVNVSMRGGVVLGGGHQGFLKGRSLLMRGGGEDERGIAGTRTLSSIPNHLVLL